MKDTADLLNAQANLVNVQIHLNLTGNIPPIYCEPNQLKQVFINILKNAIEVMPGGGNIYVTIQSSDQDHILISIQDEGTGISEDKLKRLGEPFYTTKDRERVSVSWSAIKSSKNIRDAFMWKVKKGRAPFFI